MENFVVYSPKFSLDLVMLVMPFGPLISVAHLFKLLQNYEPFQRPYKYVVPGYKHLKLSLKD
jgi:hypothetical protein